MECFIRKNFRWLIWLFCCLCELYILWQARSFHILAAPAPGMDQYTILEGSGKVAAGAMPGGDYLYSYAYTLFLAALRLLSGENLIVMRGLQAMVTALIPVFIYNTARELKMGRSAAMIGAFCYCFYAPAMLISLDFLRAAPLGLMLLLMVWLLARGDRRRDIRYALAAGLAAGVCVLGRENCAAVAVLVAVWYPVNRFGMTDVRGWRRFVAGFLGVVLAVMTLNGLLYGSFQPIPGNASNILKFYHGEAAERGAGAMLWSLVRVMPQNFAAFCSSFELPNSLSYYAYREVIDLLRILAMPFHVLCALALAGVFFFRKNRGVWTVFLIGGAYVGSMLFFTVFYRFRIPVVPLVAVLAGGGVAGLIGCVRRKRHTELIAVLVLGGAYVWLTDGGSPDRRRTASERAAVCRLLIDSGQFGRAESYLHKMERDGLEVRPGWIFLRQAMGRGEGVPALPPPSQPRVKKEFQP